MHIIMIQFQRQIPELWGSKLKKNLTPFMLLCILSEVDRSGQVPGVHDPAVLDGRGRHREDAQQRVNCPNTLQPSRHTLKHKHTHPQTQHSYLPVSPLREDHDLFLKLYHCIIRFTDQTILRLSDLCVRCRPAATSGF